MPARFPIVVISDDPDLTPTLQEAAKQGFPEAEFTQALKVEEINRDIHDLQTFSLILLDSDVRNSKSELEFLSFLRLQGELYRLPVLVVTVGQLPCDLVAAYSAEATSFTARPFSVEDWQTYLSATRQNYWAGDQ
ncbi:response regulator [Spirosoma fluminis]